MNSVKIVEDFWTAVWKSRNPDAIANFVVEDVVISVLHVGRSFQNVG
jgi:hypothetical protein